MLTPVGPVQGTVPPRETRPKMATTNTDIKDVRRLHAPQEDLGLRVVPVSTGNAQESSGRTTRRGRPSADQEYREMIHRLLAAVVRDRLGVNGSTICSLCGPLILSSANAMLKAVTPVRQGVAVSVL